MVFTFIYLGIFTTEQDTRLTKEVERGNQQFLRQMSRIDVGTSTGDTSKARRGRRSAWRNKGK